MTCLTCEFLEKQIRHWLARYDEADRCWRLFHGGDRDTYVINQSLKRDTYRQYFDIATNERDKHQRRHHPPRIVIRG